MSDRRPVLAVAATRDSTEPLRGLVRHLACFVDVRPLDRLDARPDAVLATSPRAADFAPSGVPVAVWVADARELTWITDTTPFFAGNHRNDEGSLQRTGRGWSGPDVRLVLSDDRAAIAAGAVGVSPDALDVRALPVLPPLIRARWRERHGLPARLVVAVGPEADRTGDALTNLALATAAVVSGPLLCTALALGTPVVTTAAEAERLGLRGGHEVEIAESDESDHADGPDQSDDSDGSDEPDDSQGADALAQIIAADDAWAARCSFAARRFAELELDLGRVGDLLRDRLGLSPLGQPRTDPMVRLDRCLAELSTPAASSIRARAVAATASLVPSADRS